MDFQRSDLGRSELVIFDIKKVEGFLIDFDGVLTDNKVTTNSDGVESVICSRSDGLAFDILRKLEKDVVIFSTESDQVVKHRAKKLKVDVISSVKNKEKSLLKLSQKKKWALENLFYIGNDLNDYHAMMLCGTKICPADAHPEIKKIASIILKTKGGDGVVRELLEDVFGLNLLKFME